ncbi:MAG: helix-turn-helix transcriptional regulator [Chloroflexi bacterium]|nr:helix-turn-helix transcriptional regulator [Chloroflexota bacterium]
MSIGKRLRALRQMNHLTGAKLAAQVGVSRSLISQIERDGASPSIDVLRRISAALDVPVGFFFEPTQNGPVSDQGPGPVTAGRSGQDRAKVAVIRADERPKLLLPKSNLVYELATPLSSRRLQAILAVLGPKEAGPDQPFSHDGEELNFVLSGQLTAVVDGTEYVLGSGSCISFESRVPHRLINHGDEPAVVFAVMTPAAY